MIFNKQKIGFRLTLGFGILIIITLIVGAFAYSQINTLSETINNIYKHPFVVSNTVRDIKSNIIAMHRSMKDVALAENNSQIEGASKIVDTLEKRTFESFDIVLDRFLGDKSKVRRALQSFKDWKKIRDEVIALSSSGEKIKAAQITKGKGAAHVDLMTSEIQSMVDFANNKASEFLENSKRAKEKIVELFIMIIILMIFGGVISSYFITYSIVSPLKLIVRKIRNISKGSLHQELEVKGDDEIGQLADSFRDLQSNLKEKARFAEQISKLDFNSDIVIESDADDLGKSFNAMSNSLKDATSKLRDSEEKYKVMFHSGSESVFMVDVETLEIIEANGAATKLYGYSIEEFKALKAMDLSAEPDKTEIAISKDKVHDVPIRYHKRKDGTVFPVEISASFLTFRDRRINLSTIKDITQKITREEEKKKVDKIINRSQKIEAIGTLAGGIAHDFNNMLSVIGGNVSFALTSFEGLDQDLIDILKDIENGTNQAKHLTKQLLTFAKGGDPVKKTMIVNDLIKEAVEFSLSGTIVDCKYSLECNLSPVDVDPGQFNQVISNLIINGNQAMPDGGSFMIKTENILLDANNPVNLPQGSYICVTVEDSGVGIDKDLITKIFDPYYTTKSSGSGLGLATCYSIIQKHLGEISVYSEKGKGTSFKIYLPVSNRVISEIAINGKAEHCGKGKVLVMDDQESILKIISRILKRMGYETDLATDGEIAIAKYKESIDRCEPYQLVILDLTVPGGMGGEKTIKELLKIDPNVKAVVSSGYANSQVMSHYQNYGFSGIISKPFSVDNVAKVLNDTFKS